MSLRQVSVFWVKKLMSMIAQLYDDFFTEFVTPIISVYNDIADSNQLYEKRWFSLLSCAVAQID